MERYHALLLRIWRVESEGAWRASIEDAHSGERRGFSDLTALLSFLQALQETQPPQRAGQAPAETPEAAPRRPTAKK